MKTWTYVVGAVCAVALFCAQSAYGASSEMEILLKKLQEKGILTESEAQEIAAETKKAAEEEKAQPQETAAKTAGSGGRGERGSDGDTDGDGRDEKGRRSNGRAARLDQEYQVQRRPETPLRGPGQGRRRKGHPRQRSLQIEGRPDHRDNRRHRGRVQPGRRHGGPALCQPDA